MATDNGQLHDDRNRKPLLTIGYGGKRSADEFVELLRRQGVRYLADVRSMPFSKFRPEFCKDALSAILNRSGIVYLYMGDSLGGMPIDQTCYTDGKVDYDKVREREWFMRGLERLETGWRGGHRIAIMCAELEPEHCHRTKLVSEALTALGVAVSHVGKDGELITHDAVMARQNGGQSALFDVGYASRRMSRRAP